MATDVSIIGQSTRVRGRIIGTADVEVNGFVEGEVAVSGAVIVGVHGMVGAGVAGRRIVIRGSVRGDLVGVESVTVEEGGRVVGDVRAPSVAIAPGALVRGYVQAGETDAMPAIARVSESAKVAPAPAIAVRSAAKVQAPAALVGASGRHAVAAPVSSARAPMAAQQSVPVSTRAGGQTQSPAPKPPAPQQATRQPPPAPVVPALKKVRGQMAKKRER